MSYWAKYFAKDKTKGPQPREAEGHIGAGGDIDQILIVFDS